MGHAADYREVFMTHSPNTSAMVQMPDKAKKKSNPIICAECSRNLGPDDYILSKDPMAKEVDGKVKRGNWCQKCYKQREYDAGFRKGKKKPKKIEDQEY